MSLCINNVYFAYHNRRYKKRMFEKTKYFNKLEEMISEGQNDGFIMAYQTAPFDIEQHDPLFGRSKISLVTFALEQGNDKVAQYLINRFESNPGDEIYAENKVDLLKTAMIHNRVSIAEHLIDQIGVENVADERIYYYEDSSHMRATMLYRALDLGMEGITWRLLKAPAVYIDGGLEKECSRYNFTTKSTEHYWSERDTTFAIAERLGDAPVVKALYDMEISGLEEHGKDVRENAWILPNWRADRIERKVEEFRATRDDIVERCVKNGSSLTPDPKPPKI